MNSIYKLSIFCFVFSLFALTTSCKKDDDSKNNGEDSTKRYNCVNGNCIEAPEGVFTSLTACKDNCPLYPGTIDTLHCNNTINSGTLRKGVVASAVTSLIPYSGGNTEVHGAQIVNSKGVTGLTAALDSGRFAFGDGFLTYTITGTPTDEGIARFELTIGGKTCTLERTVFSTEPQYPPGSVHCNTVPTAIVDVTNPATGKTWMDRNLGANGIGATSIDPQGFGDLFQWGRRADGHQCRFNTNFTVNLSSTAQPLHGIFIGASNPPHDWLSPQNDNLWQGVKGVNNPCPSGYRLPTEAELNEERLSWSSNDMTGAFSSPLKWTAGGYKSHNSGFILDAGGNFGYYWSSTTFNTFARRLFISDSLAAVISKDRAFGYSVRCIKD